MTKFSAPHVCRGGLKPDRFFFIVSSYRYNKFFRLPSYPPHSQLPEIVNSLSPQGQLPLGIALLSRSTAIAQTLVKNGKADLNAYDGEVICSIHKLGAASDCDEFRMRAA